jgi:hypothetical protein
LHLQVSAPCRAHNLKASAELNPGRVHTGSFTTPLLIRFPLNIPNLII